MAPFEVNVYQSERLTAHCREEYGASERWRAAERIVAHFEHAVSLAGGCDLTADATAVREAVPAPIEDTDVAAEVTTDADDPDVPDPPCGHGGTVYYDNLLGWWKEYGPCELADPAADANLLVTYTDYDDGGRSWIGGAPYGTARVGKYCAQAPDPAVYAKEPHYYGDGTGIGDEYFALNTAIHEIGHNLVENVENLADPDEADTCADHFSAHHRMGTVYEEYGLGGPADVTYTDSPMSHGSYNECMTNNDGSNYCQTGPDHDVSEVEAHDLRYSPCAIANLETPASED